MEVIASSTILIVGLTGVVAATGTAVHVFDKQTHITKALHLAEGTLESLLLKYPGHEDIQEGNHELCFEKAAASPVDCTSPLVFFKVQWTVFSYTDPVNPIGGLVHIALRCEWEGRFGVQAIDGFNVVRR